MSYDDWTARAGPGTFIPMPWTPDPPVVARTGRGRRAMVAGAVAALLAGCGTFGYLAWHDDRSAVKWRSLDRRDAARSAAVTKQLETANSRIQVLDGQVTSLDSQMSGLQTQLSSVADQKEKAVDQETVLQQLLSAAGTVADDLQQCITATNQFDSDFNSAFNGTGLGRLSDLQSEAKQVDQTCSTAETANQQLQAAIQNSR